MKKKGQAAMEFLMTYGWAILAAIIVVGVLWYIIGDPGNLAGNNFQISTPFVTNAMSITAGAAGAGTIELEVKNGRGEDITITQVKIAPECANVIVDTADVALADGAIGAVTVTCPLALVSGDRINSAVTIYYTVGLGSVEQQASGSINAKVP